MQKQSDYWSAWMAGWVSAAKSIIEAQQRALEMFLPLSRRRNGEWSLPATAGDKPLLPAGRRRRSPKSRAGAGQNAPRRRGRPPKSARGKS